MQPHTNSDSDSHVDKRGYVGSQTGWILLPPII